MLSLFSGASGALGSVQVNKFVCLVLGSLHGWVLGKKLLYHFKFSSEQGVLLHVHHIGVHLEHVEIEAGDSFNEAIEGIFHLLRIEFVDIDKIKFFIPHLVFPEETSDDRAGGGPGKAHLAGQDDGGVELSSLEGGGQEVIIFVGRRARVTHGHSDKLQPWQR